MTGNTHFGRNMQFDELDEVTAALLVYSRTWSKENGPRSANIDFFKKSGTLLASGYFKVHSESPDDGIFGIAQHRNEGEQHSKRPFISHS